MLCSMRHLEVHVIETEQDIDLAIQAGLLTGSQLDHSYCAECDESVGHSLEVGNFIPFSVVLDSDDNSWPVCSDCAGPVTDSVNFYTGTFHEDDLEIF